MYFVGIYPVRSIVIDGSQMGKNNAALMISIVWQNRGIPIAGS